MTHVGDGLDQVDQQLVDELLSNGRAKLSDLGAKVMLSASAVHARLHRLEATGVIEGYRAVINPEKLGFAVSAFVAVTPTDPADHADLAEKLVKYPEVETCYSLAGTADYLMLVRVASATALGEFLSEIRTALRVNSQAGVITKSCSASPR
ncbi:Lrp/AsnC family transcriptional regulator [Rhodococcus sp. D2-41]|uniref:Lrp/AsnC family transcriptional regulator n=1 Tax=Speluncibacter jeojiensis TaxID=2710754 RepID=A0A9X4LXE1_9ACTN|nr:Lrp/AsnC family transcriptional regulator [Rhodococcus sp. D2-41]MDG3010378.1 Lrp/AsnC family transcriptional regulator [Rhodococcus sp. D2-41]MDG3014115.1 Lrp/AsnC family transcriptional regulator [Corynebacteriales bacterium D3-21]